MASSRRVIYEASFGESAKYFGGYEAIDVVVDPIVDGLYRNPFGFELVEQAWQGGVIICRYAITNPVRNIPALCVQFRIDGNGDVFLCHVEEFVGY